MIYAPEYSYKTLNTCDDLQNDPKDQTNFLHSFPFVMMFPNTEKTLFNLDINFQVDK